MAGTIYGLGLSQQFGADAEPLGGCKLYLYAENTSTPANAYEDFGLTLVLPHPIVADSAGRIPAFWLADGAYRVRLVDADGNEIFDEQSITAIGASSGTGGGGSSVEAAAIFQTGDFLWVPVSGARTGWVRANGRTVGSVASGATERANSDTEDLFLYLWTEYSDALCPVSGGRGGSAAADFAANKAIGTLDMRSKGLFGSDTMGNTAAGITGGSTAIGATVGASTYTIAQVNLPNVNLSSSALDGGISTTITNGTNVLRGTNLTGVDTAGDDNASAPQSSATTTTLTLASSDVTITGTIPLGGSGTDLDILPPARIGTWYIKL
jgi:hypothetical protein